ncbi:OB-fold nucleic acid binding domain-containing protein [Sinomonas sp. ASV486]|uniref:OB-fold nucleic acid binding domain-containing protein n=1 Tax=Sinomonas puerhi TaxID=3238584 RepID=A0AB39L860_9MICC|nr:OB-fold nucleic acid binding domain-containing protein [Sinomonas sp. ASV486]MDQ4489685.1 OB-fold nucleic acid binding domain-containing protein [Sinomonas sp. ASV486]
MAERTGAIRLEGFGGLPERGLVAGQGVVRSLTFVPAGDAPRLTAVIEDESALPGRGPALCLVWLGRRRVSGVNAGTRLRFSGMLAHFHGTPTIYNPRYEILAQED